MIAFFVRLSSFLMLFLSGLLISSRFLFGVVRSGFIFYCVFILLLTFVCWDSKLCCFCNFLSIFFVIFS